LSGTEQNKIQNTKGVNMFQDVTYITNHQSQSIQLANHLLTISLEVLDRRMLVIGMVLVFRLDGIEMGQDFVVGEDGVLRF